MRTSALTTQPDSPWGLASISSRKAGATSYIYDDSAGKGTFSYVLGKLGNGYAGPGLILTYLCQDTGVRITHNDFEGRAIWGFNAVRGSQDIDEDGHGT